VIGDRKYKEQEIYVAAVFLDAEKVFDRTRYAGLVYKLLNLNFPGLVVKLIHSQLQSRTFRISVEGGVSTSRSVEAGVAQGSIPAPILYSMYLYYVSAKEVGVDFALYGDDTALFTSDINTSRAMLKSRRTVTKIEGWCSNGISR
jgi:hypothetical protein